MPNPIVSMTGRGWTYGCEHELADWDTVVSLPLGHGRSDDWTLVNSNGVAVQPNPKTYQYGGEVNTPPTDSPEGQVKCLASVLVMHPSASVNYRSNLHVHVRAPGLKGCLRTLKKVQAYVHEQLPRILDLLEPIPPASSPAARKRERRRKVSHHTFLTPRRLDQQLSARTVTEFFESEVPRSGSGKVMWHAQPRCCVNLRQLLQTDTVEFRHFPGTLDGDELLTCVEWCRDFLLAALCYRPVVDLWREYGRRPLPSFPEFDEETEIRYRGTAAHSGLSAAEIRTNINLILSGRFNAHDSPDAYGKASERAGVVPRKYLSVSSGWGGPGRSDRGRSGPVAGTQGLFD